VAGAILAKDVANELKTKGFRPQKSDLPNHPEGVIWNGFGFGFGFG
jgi:hypothetical protein